MAWEAGLAKFEGRRLAGISDVGAGSPAERLSRLEEGPGDVQPRARLTGSILNEGPLIKNMPPRLAQRVRVCGPS